MLLLDCERLIIKERDGIHLLKRKRLTLLSVTAFIFLLFLAVLNNNSLNYAKNACIDNNKTPLVDKTLFAINWSVSCK